MFKGNYLPTHQQRKVQLEAKYQRAIETGVYRPYVYPFCSLSVLLIILYFLIPHRNKPLLRGLGFAAWAVNVVFSLYIILYTRGPRAPIDYGVGLIHWWFVLWTTAVMVAYDGQVEFSRIERVGGATRTLPGLQSSESNSTVANESKGKEERDVDSLMWEDYPTGSFIERVDWVFDLLSNFRGMAWNFRIPNLPSPPKAVQKAIVDTNGSARKEIAGPRPAFQSLSRGELLKDATRRFIVGYIWLDFLRTITIHDPYYRGLGTHHKPKVLPTLIQDSPALLQAYRLLIALLALYWALSTIFQLAPLFFVGVLGSKLIGVRGEPWMYPREWGNYSVVLDRGLGGFWGSWWHQTFRFAFEAPSRRVTELLHIDRKSLTGKVLQLFIAFALSGSIHASGSHTSIGDTRPIRGPFLFFILQPIGIIGQLVLAKILDSAGLAKRTPHLVRRAVNFLVVHLWLFYTAPLLIDDLAKGGTFLYEPVPFSIFRLLGLGGKNESRICWEMGWFSWHTGKHWWDSGLGT
jgi:hypothetical protein